MVSIINSELLIRIWNQLKEAKELGIRSHPVVMFFNTTSPAIRASPYSLDCYHQMKCLHKKWNMMSERDAG